MLTVPAPVTPGNAWTCLLQLILQVYLGCLRRRTSPRAARLVIVSTFSGLNPGIGPEHANQTLQEHSGADQQHYGQRDFRHHQTAAQALTDAAAGVASTFFQHAALVPIARTAMPERSPKMIPVSTDRPN